MDLGFIMFELIFGVSSILGKLLGSLFWPFGSDSVIDLIHLTLTYVPFLLVFYNFESKHNGYQYSLPISSQSIEVDSCVHLYS